MDLELDISDLVPNGSRRGARSKSLSMSVERELVLEDVRALSEPVDAGQSRLKTISQRHHALARELASGTRPGKAGMIHGYSVSRVSILTADPTFKELIRHYESEVNIAFADTGARLSEIADDALELLRMRVEEEPDELETKELIEIAKLGADRSGHGPQSNVVNDVRIGLGQKLQAALERRESIKPVSLENIEEAQILDE